MSKPFDPTITALAEWPEQAAARREAEKNAAQVDTLIAENWIDREWALIAMYGWITKIDESEVQAARDEEAQEPNAEKILAGFDGVSEWIGNETLVWNTGDDVLGWGNETWENEPEKTWVQESWNTEDVKQEENVGWTENQSPDTERQKEEHPMTPSIKHLRKSGKIKTQQQEDELIEHFANDILSRTKQACKKGKKASFDQFFN